MFTRFFIDHPIFASVLAIIIVIAGGITIPFLPIEQFPDITPPTVMVTTTYPGADAQVIADTVTTPIEEEVNGVDNMIYMSSKSSNDGSMNLTVTFKIGTDIDMATVLVQNRVAIAQPKLPEEVKREGVTTKKQSPNLTLAVSLVSPNEEYDYLYLSNYATVNIKDVLSRVEGVGEVSIMGGQDFGMRVWLDPHLLAARNMTTTDVLAAIREQNVQVAAGQIGQSPAPDNQSFQYTITTKGRLETAKEFGDIIIRTGEDGRLLRLKDVARIELGSQSYDMYTLLDGKPSATIGIYQLPGANALNLAAGIKKTMEELGRAFPPGLEYKIVYDSTLFVTASIKEVVTTLFIAFLLVFLTVYVFLQDLRATLIPAVTIPVSLIGTFGAMMVIGFSINTLTLFGLVLVIGIVVDDAIVVVENVTRLIDTEGLSARDATKKAMDEVTGPIIATTLVLLGVFIPTAFLGGITGQLYKQFALTIATATVFSSINALTLSPALCAILLRPTPTKRGPFFSLFNLGFDRTSHVYAWMVNHVVRRTTIAMLVLFVIFGLAASGFKIVPTGFIPDEDQGYFFVNIQLPDAASLERTSKIVERVEKIVSETPGVAHVISVGGFSMLNSTSAPNTGALIVTLDPWEERSTHETQLDSIIHSITAKFQTVEEAIVFAFIPPAISGLGNAGGFQFQLEDRANVGLVALQTVATDLIDHANHAPELFAVNTTFRATVPQVYINIDRVKVKKLGINLDSVFQTLQANLGSAYVNDFNRFGHTYKVMVQADKEFRNRVDDIYQLKVRSSTGQMVPLHTLLKAEEISGPQIIERYNMYPTASITGMPATGYSSGQSIAEMEALAKDLLPSSMGHEWTGMSFQEIEAGSSAIYVFALALIFVFLFLAAQYDSWAIPLAVLLSVPLAIFGAILITFVRAMDNNIYTQIGLVLLIGLASKNAILIVEFARQQREEGNSVLDSAINAAKLRFRPILMTSFAFILGVFPLVIATGAGAASRQSLGTAVFGGMIAATILGVLFVPALYVVIQRMSDWYGKKKEK